MIGGEILLTSFLQLTSARYVTNYAPQYFYDHYVGWDYFFSYGASYFSSSSFPDAEAIPRKIFHQPIFSDLGN